MKNIDEIKREVNKSIQEKFSWVEGIEPVITYKKETNDPTHYKKVSLDYPGEKTYERWEFIYKKTMDEHTRIVRVLTDAEGNILKISVSK